MKNFYEFGRNQNEYYALIAADTKEQAVEAYKELVNDEAEPIAVRILPHEAENLLKKSVSEDNSTNSDKEFEYALNCKIPHLLIIDGMLI